MRSLKKIILVFVFMATSAFLAANQQLAAKILGKVTDMEGTGLRHVEVKATNINNGEVSTTHSDKRGNFRILSLAPGEYQVSFDLEGYQSCVISGVKLLAEQSITLRPKLKKKESAESES